MEEIASNAESQVCYCAVNAHDIDKYAINCSTVRQNFQGIIRYQGMPYLNFVVEMELFVISFHCLNLKHRWTNLGPEAQFVEARHSFKVDPSFKLSVFLNTMGKKGGKRGGKREREKKIDTDVMVYSS